MFGLLKKMFTSAPPVNFKQLVNEGALVVDVRTPGEFAGGHVPGSINIPLDVLDGRVADLKKKNKTIITCCRSGSRSGMALGILQNAGIPSFNGGPWNVLNQQLK